MTGRAHFEDEKRLLNEDILQMGVRVEEDLRKALEAFRTQNKTLAQEVKADDPIVNDFQLKIEDRCARLLATQQPVAQDLRCLVSAIKIADELERIGDHTVHLAKAAIKLEGEPYIKPLASIEKMAETGCVMIRMAVDSFLTLDVEKARATAAMDDEIDRLHKVLVGELLEYLRETPGKAQQGTKIIQTSGFLERLGDHVTNICETVVYAVDGRHEELND
ncbi:MAG: phosphate signaling complex protein PhoU [Treponemataceae bacterium]